LKFLVVSSGTSYAALWAGMGIKPTRKATGSTADLQEAPNLRTDSVRYGPTTSRWIKQILKLQWAITGFADED
jgi:hypothetical protein